MPAQRAKRLSFYLVILALVLTVPSLAFSGYLAIQYANKQVEALEDVVEDLNGEAVLSINNDIWKKLSELRQLAASDLFELQNLKAFEAELRSKAKAERNQLILLDVSGERLIDTNVDSDRPLPKARDPLIDLPRLARENEYFSDSYANGASHTPSWTIVVPVRRGGAMVAVLQLRLERDWLDRLLSRSLPQLGPYFSSVFDRQGQEIARSHDIAPLKLSFPRRAGTQGNYSTKDTQDIPVFVHWHRVELPGWVITTAITEETLREPLVRDLVTLCIAGALLLTIAALVSYWIGRRLVKAHTLLEGTARAMSSGNAVEPPRTGLAETDYIANALAAASRSILNHSAQLQRINERLETRVEVRTRELRREASLLQTTLETMQQGLIVVDPQGRLTICNAQARLLLELPSDLMISSPTRDEIFEYKSNQADCSICIRDIFELLKPDDSLGLVNFEHSRPNGTILLVSTAPIPGGGFLRTYLDVTEERRQQQDLEKARRDAELASRAKGDFLATMSHEMRTPLNAIIGYSDLLAADSKKTVSETRRYAHRIGAAAANLLALVNDILDLGKIEAGVMDIRHEPFCLKQLVEEAVSIIRPAAETKGLTVRVDRTMASDLWFVGDRDRLQQILLNLLSNANKFTANGGIGIRVQVHPAEKTDRWRLHFAVSYTGIGRLESDRTHLFQRFHQLDRLHDRATGGAGLGLAICKQLVELLGGTIGLDSVPGQGSTFWFEVDLARGKPALSSIPKTSPKKRAARKILVVEDDEFSRDLLQDLLVREGHHVDTAQDGAIAVSIASKTKFDAILMDLSMPKMDGFEAATTIRALESCGRYTPIIACTANLLPATIKRMQSAVFDAYVEKPVRLQDLYALVDQIFEQPASSRRDLSEPTMLPGFDEGFMPLLSALGPDRLIGELGKLTLGLRSILSEADRVGAPNAVLGECAHKLVSSAAIFDLTDLARALRNLEDACRKTEGDVLKAVNDIRPVIHEALATIQRLVERFSGEQKMLGPRREDISFPQQRL